MGTSGCPKERISINIFNQFEKPYFRNTII